MKTRINVVAGLLFSLSLQAQVTPEFYHAFHFNDLNYGKDIIATSDFRLVVIGWTYSYGNWDSYASPLIQLDEQGNLLDTLFLPFGLSTVTETNDGNYLSGGDDFTYKVSPAGDSVWEKPYPSGPYGASIGGIVQLNDSVFMIHLTRYTGENQQDPYAKILLLDENGDFIDDNTLTVWPALAVDVEATPSGRGIALAGPRQGIAVFLGDENGMEKELIVPLWPSDLVIADDSTYIILGDVSDCRGFIKTNAFFDTTAYRDDICQHAFYHACLMNDTLLAAAAGDSEGLYIALFDLDLNLKGIDTLSELAGHNITQIVSPSVNHLALTGYRGIHNDSTDLIVIGLDVEPFYQNTQEMPLAEAIRIFPNPSNGIFNIEVDDETKMVTALEVFSIDGRAVACKVVEDSGMLRIDLLQAEPGIYFLRLKAATGFHDIKLIKI